MKIRISEKANKGFIEKADKLSSTDKLSERNEVPKVSHLIFRSGQSLLRYARQACLRCSTPDRMTVLLIFLILTPEFYILSSAFPTKKKPGWLPG
ncbi:MAG: hypothetical protein JW784_02025 [Candidatus Cloacimonetes bacterium]|nr:hypothetical protein [Candidatus Cloacimonadota bacterium]